MTSLASLLSYNEIKKVAPRLARLIDASPRLAAIVQNSLPSVAIITFNGLLPFLLSCQSLLVGRHPIQADHRRDVLSARVQVEELLRVFSDAQVSQRSAVGNRDRLADAHYRYYLFLLVSVLFIFLLTTTIWAIFRDLADTPMKVSTAPKLGSQPTLTSPQIPEKLAAGLQGANSRNFMVSYVMLQGKCLRTGTFRGSCQLIVPGLGLMPLQLINLGPLLSLGWARALYTKTPRGQC